MVAMVGPVTKPDTLALLAVAACLLAGDPANAGSTCAAAGGTFEAAVEALFLTPSRSVETPGQGGRAFQLLWCAASEKAGV